MRAESVGASIQRRDQRGNHLLDSPGEMPFRKMDAETEIDHLLQEIRTKTETLEDVRHPRPMRIRFLVGPVDLGQLTVGLFIIDPANEGHQESRVGGWRTEA